VPPCLRGSPFPAQAAPKSIEDATEGPRLASVQGAGQDNRWPCLFISYIIA